jgi:hypothetical protein
MVIKIPSFEMTGINVADKGKSGDSEKNTTMAEFAGESPLFPY